MAKEKTTATVETVNAKISSVIPSAPPIDKVEFLTATMLAERVLKDQLGPHDVSHLNLENGSTFEFWPSNAEGLYKVSISADQTKVDVEPTPPEGKGAAIEGPEIKTPWLSIIPSAALQMRNSRLDRQGRMDLNYSQGDFQRSLKEYGVNLSAAPAPTSKGQQKPKTLDDYNKPIGDPKMNAITAVVAQAQKIAGTPEGGGAEPKMSFEIYEAAAAENLKLTKERHAREMQNPLPPPRPKEKEPPELRLPAPPRLAPPPIGPERRLAPPRVSR